MNLNFQGILPPKTDISHKNQWLEDEISFEMVPFLGGHVNFPGHNYILITIF